jgi:two-component system CheB/CheR fusion protein
MDPPFTKVDVLSCRNLLIYLDAELQKMLLSIFCHSLNPGGILFLGSAETVGSSSHLFAPLDSKSGLFRRRESAVPPESVERPAPSVPAWQEAPKGREMPKPPVSLQSLAEQVLLQHYAPPAVLVTDRGDICYVSGRTGKYLEPAAGKANLNVFAMAREGLRYELARAFRKALRQKGAVILRNVKVRTDGKVQAVDLTIQLLQKPEGLRGMVLIVFTDVAAAPAVKARGRTRPDPVRSVRVAELEQEFQRTRAELQATREDMQNSQEELKSINEELQSTNEELTTSKEEMQSLNEELQTVNAELQAKVDELSLANSDLKNLLNSTDIATVFLDSALNVRRFTTQASRIIKLIPGDVGRPVTDLASVLLYPELPEDAREVLRTLAVTEKAIATRDGGWLAVRIMPYRTLDNVIDGLVMTFTDITAAKTLEAQLRRTLDEERGGRAQG